ncbi:MAG: TolC family protein [Polyangiaceae bacterium]|nr:TolC family protein [Polyangiaceae bacterium]
MIATWSAEPARGAPLAVGGDSLAGAASRVAIIREALAKNPGLKAAADRVRAARSTSAAEGRLPDPELMFQIWQVPFEHPASFRDSQMIMAGVSQTFPAPGSLPARADARRHAASADEAMLADRARDVVRDVQHAFADLTEAVARHRAHVEHHDVAARLLAASQARQRAGGPLDDVTQAELATARLDADIAMEAGSVARAKARLNGLLGRPIDAQMGDPRPEEPATIALSPQALTELAARTRPDLRAAGARDEAERSALVSAEREATLPSFTVGAQYFAPTSTMPVHGYGVSAAMTLPWVWGGGAARAEAARALVQAAGEEVAEAKLRIDVDVGTSLATAHAVATQLRTLESGARPAAQRAFDAVFAVYAAGRGDLLAVLRAEQAVADIEIDIVVARASLDHALADLDWAVGVLLPRTPLETPSSTAGR